MKTSHIDFNAFTYIYVDIRIFWDVSIEGKRSKDHMKFK